MLDSAAVKTISDVVVNNPAVTAALATGLLAVASEVIGWLPIKSNGVIHLLINIGKAVVKYAINKKGN